MFSSAGAGNSIESMPYPEVQKIPVFFSVQVLFSKFIKTGAISPLVYSSFLCSYTGLMKHLHTSYYTHKV